MRWGSKLVMTAAPVAARPFLKVFLGWDSSQFKRLMDKLLDALLHLVHFLLRIDERFGDGVAQKGVPFGFEGGNFAAVKRKALMLLLMQGAALFREALILLLRLGVRHEGIDPLPDALELGLLDNGFAQFQSFLPHRVVDLCNGLHANKHAPGFSESQVPGLTFFADIL